MEEINTNQYKNIVIIGGSHSGFSSAWLMLHGPATFNKNNSINSEKYSSMPDAPMKSNEKILEAIQMAWIEEKQMAIQQTLAMIKPDAVQRNLIGSIIQLIEANKLVVKKIIMMKYYYLIMDMFILMKDYLKL